MTILIVLAIGCLSFAFYLSKYERDPLAIIDFTSMGCFHHYSYKLTLLKKGDSAFARIDSAGNLKEERYISNKQLDTFKIFMKELGKIHNMGNCTTTQVYKITIDDMLINQVDGNCNWVGFGKLTYCFFKHQY
jgi:hypothetical protein